MLARRCLPLFLLVIAAMPYRSFAEAEGGAPAIDESRFKLVYSVTGNNEYELESFFVGDRVVEFDDETKKPTVMFDMQKKSWKEFESGKNVTIKDAEAWATASLKRSSERIEQLKKERADLQAALRLIEFTFDPKFDIQEKDDTLILDSEMMRYEIRNNKAVSDNIRSRIFAYDKLNAYRKAMVQRKLAPLVQLEVDRIMAEKDYFPAELSMTLTVVDEKGDENKIALIMKMSFSPLSDEELERVENVLREDPADER